MIDAKCNFSLRKLKTLISKRNGQETADEVEERNSRTDDGPELSGEITLHGPGNKYYQPFLLIRVGRKHPKPSNVTTVGTINVGINTRTKIYVYVYVRTPAKESIGR